MPYARPWIKQLGLSIGLAIVFIAAFVYFTAPPCAFGAAECPVGSTSVFSENIGIQGGTTFTTTINSSPTVDGVYTIPDSAGNDTFSLLHTAAIRTTTLTFNDDVRLSFGTGGDGTITSVAGTGITLEPDAVGNGDVVIYSADGGPGGPILNIRHDSASPAVNDTSMLRFLNDNSIGSAEISSSIRSVLTNPVDGAEETALDFYTRAAGSVPVIHLRIGNNGVLSIRTQQAPTAGNGGIIFADQTAFSGMPTNTAGIYSDDVAGTVELFAIDEAGNATQISPHPSDFLNTLGLNCDLPWAFESSNPYIGKKISVDLCGAIEALELLTGQTFITITDLPLEELRDWDNDQQSNFDKCIAEGGEAGEACVQEQPPQWMIDRGVLAVE